MQNFFISFHKKCLAANPHIRMISEESCDTEDCSDVEKLVLHHSNKLHSKKCWGASTQIWVKYGQTQMLG